MKKPQHAPLVPIRNLSSKDKGLGREIAIKSPLSSLFNVAASVLKTVPRRILFKSGHTRSQFNLMPSREIDVADYFDAAEAYR
jgi:hypothetical protein